MSAADQLKSIVERVERLEAEIKALNDDKSDIYKEARANGFDVKTIKKVVSQRKLDSNERQEADIMFETYWNAVHGVNLVHARVHGNIEEFDAETDELLTPASDDTPIVPPSQAESEAEDISATQFEADPADAAVTAGDDLREPVAAEQGQIIREGDAPRETGHHDDGDASGPDTEFQMDRAGRTTAEPNNAMAAENARKAVPETEDGSVSHAQVGERPATNSTQKTARDYRPHCVRPEACAASSLSHCYSCARLIEREMA